DPRAVRAPAADQHPDNPGAHVALDRLRAACRADPGLDRDQPALHAPARRQHGRKGAARLCDLHGDRRVARHQEDRRHQGLGDRMVLTLILGLVLTAAAVALVARAFILSRLRATDMLSSIGHYGFAGGVELEPSPGVKGFIDDIAGAIGTLLLSRLQFGSEEELRKQLIAAGMYRVTARMLRGYQALFALVPPALWI